LAIHICSKCFAYCTDGLIGLIFPNYADDAIADIWNVGAYLEHGKSLFYPHTQNPKGVGLFYIAINPVKLVIKEEDIWR
jgi:hypothetical protein